MKFREFTAGAILTFWVSVWLLGCSAKEKSPVETPNAPPVTAKEIGPQPTIDEGITALLRSHPHSKKVCYDSAWGYYIIYPVLPDGADDDGDFHGTYLLKNPKFHKSANETWFTEEALFSDYTQVYPDLINLPCKDQH